VYRLLSAQPIVQMANMLMIRTPVRTVQTTVIRVTMVLLVIPVKTDCVSHVPRVMEFVLTKSAKLTPHGTIIVDSVHVYQLSYSMKQPTIAVMNTVLIVPMLNHVNCVRLTGSVLLHLISAIYVVLMEHTTLTGIHVSALVDGLDSLAI
jgi:hypothetical protein